MPRDADIVTYFFARLDEGGPGRLDVVEDAVARAGGAVVDGGGVFGVAADALRAALEVLEAGAGVVEGMRLAVWTTDAGLVAADAVAAAALLDAARPAQVLLSAGTAVMASGALPSSAELVERGRVALRQPGAPERVYEVVFEHATGDPGGVRPAGGRSNLDWARRAAHGPVVGRSDALATLRSVWEGTLRGERRLALVAGDAGVGKTAAVAELALELHAAGALVLYGRWDPEPMAPLQAVREAFGSYGASCPPEVLEREVAGFAADIARLVPDIGVRIAPRRSATEMADGADPGGERLRLFDAVEEWLDRLAAERPVLLVLDDQHWADGSSSFLLDHLRHSPSERPWTVVATRRTTPGVAGTAGSVATTLAPFVDGGADVVRVDLQGLGRAAVTELAGHVLGAAQAGDDRVVEWLCESTAGNPLFLMVTLQALADDPAAGGWRTGDGTVPQRLVDVVGWRVGQLPDASRAVLADAAVIGSTFDEDVLAAASERSQALLRERLSAPIDAGLLGVTETSDVYAFTHEVVRRVLWDGLAADRRAAVHRRVARALAARTDAGIRVSAAEVAHHHLAASDADPMGDAGVAGDAVEWARRAATEAVRATAFDQAVGLLKRAVEVHDRVTGEGTGADAGEHAVVACELRLELAGALDLADEFPARDDCYHEAAAVARRLGRLDLLTRAALGVGGRLPGVPLGQPDATRVLLEVLDRTPAEDQARRALVLARLAQLPPAAGDGRAISDEALAIAHEVGDLHLLASVLIARTFVIDGPDDIAERRNIGEDVLRLGRELEDPDMVLQGLRVLAPALLTLGQHVEARTAAAEFERLAHEVRHPDYLRLAAMWEIMWATLEGRLQEAEALSTRLERRLRTAGHAQAAALGFAQRSAIWLQRGNLATPAAEVAHLGPTITGRGAVWALLRCAEALGEQADVARDQLVERDPHRFLADLEEDLLWWAGIVLATIAAVEVGDTRWARVLRDALTRHAGCNASFGHTGFLGAVDHHLGTLALTLGRADEAVGLLLSGLARHEVLGAAPFVRSSQQWLDRARSAVGGAEATPAS